MLIETDRTSAPFCSVQTTRNVNTHNISSDSNTNNTSCHPFNSYYCRKFHKHQILQAANNANSTSTLACRKKVNRKKAISLNLNGKSRHIKIPSRKNPLVNLSNSRSKANNISRSFPVVGDSYQSNTKNTSGNRRKRVHIEKEINNITREAKKNVNTKRLNGNANDVRFLDNSKQSSSLSSYNNDIVANTFGKCTNNVTKAGVQLTPALIINNSDLESSASSVKRRFSIYQPRFEHYYKGSSLSLSRDISPVSSITTYAIVNSFSKNYHSQQNNYLQRDTIGIRTNSVRITNNIENQEATNTSKKINSANSIIYPSNTNIVNDTYTNTKRNSSKSTCTNTDSAFDSDATDATIFTKVCSRNLENLNTNPSRSTNGNIYARSLSLAPKEITLKSYFDATCEYVNTLVYLVQTEVLSMGKIQDLKDKVGANQLTMPQKDIWKCLGAEFLGTALLVLIGCGSGLYTSLDTKTPLVGNALCWGLLVASLAQSLGGVSGCHINPAITLAMLVTGKIQLVKAGLYMISQVGGAIVGMCVLKALVPEGILGNYNPTELHKSLTPLQGFGIEVILTFTLATIVFGTGDENRIDILGSKPLAVGLTVSSMVIFGGPYTGASMNPARSLAPSIVSGSWDNHWVFWLGPMCGAVLAGVLYQNVFRASRSDEIETFELEKDSRSRQLEVKENGASPPV